MQHRCVWMHSCVSYGRFLVNYVPKTCPIEDSFNLNIAESQFWLYQPYHTTDFVLIFWFFCCLFVCFLILAGWSSLLVHFIRMLSVSSSLVSTCKIKWIVFLHWNELDYCVCGKTYLCILYMWQRIRCFGMLGLVHTQCTIWWGRGEKTITLAVYISVCVQKKLESIRHFPLSGHWWLFNPSCSIRPPHGECSDQSLPVFVKPSLVVVLGGCECDLSPLTCT